MTSKPSTIAAAAALLGAALCMPTHAQTPTEAELARKLDRLAAELAEAKAQLARLRESAGAGAANANTTSPPTAAASPGTAAAAAQPPAAASAAPVPVPARAAAGRDEPATVLTSYGEVDYTRPTKAARDAEIDLRRFVLGLQHRFDSKTRLVAELEVEHAVSSADDPGEVALEQAYVERELAPRLAARAGLFLMPAGMLNESHEPTSYYGVRRNFVETAIIPSTWREVGLELIGNFDNGVTVQGGISTSFDLGKWDAASAEGLESPLGSIHQEGRRRVRATSRSSARSTGAECRGCWSGARCSAAAPATRSRCCRVRACRCGTCMRAGRRAAGTCPPSTRAARSRTRRHSTPRW